MIRIICVGKLSQSYLKTGIDFYEKQVPVKLEWIEVTDAPNKDGLKDEGLRIMKKLKDNDHVVALEIQGTMTDSEGFARLIERIDTYAQGDLVFVIGGSYGLDSEVLKRANDRLSFSKLTFPHQMMRLILIEQIYRGYMILKNHPYHK